MNEEEMKQLKWFEKRYGPYIPEKGLRNWKLLFRMPTMYEWTILFMLAMGLFMAWAYYHDIEACQINCERSKLFDNINQGPNYEPIDLEDIVFNENLSLDLASNLTGNFNFTSNLTFKEETWKIGDTKL